MFILTFSMSGFSSIYLPLLVKHVLCVFLECFKCEITEILGILNFKPFEHSRSTEILNFWGVLPLTPPGGSKDPLNIHTSHAKNYLIFDFTMKGW